MHFCNKKKTILMPFSCKNHWQFIFYTKNNSSEKIENNLYIKNHIQVNAPKNYRYKFKSKICLLK